MVKVILTNIDSFMTPFLRMLYDGVTTTFNTMQSFEFGNTNMLQVMITIMILGVAIPIFLTFAKNIGYEKADRGGKSDTK